jgi:hypothetical protein
MTARIYRPTKSATQSGSARTKLWLLEFPSQDREIDPLMGWTSSDDTRPQVQLRFADKEEAVDYANKHGIDFRVEEPKPEKRRIMAYADNFSPGRRGLWTH